MYKLLLSILVGSTLSFAGIINGIAITVNGEPITLYDIDKKMVKENTILTIRDIREGGIQKIPISEKIKYLQQKWIKYWWHFSPIVSCYP